MLVGRGAYSDNEIGHYTIMSNLTSKLLKKSIATL